jgi:aromatic ring-cleaving dioxygenase
MLVSGRIVPYVQNMYASNLTDDTFKKVVNVLNIDEETLIDMTLDETRILLEDAYDVAEKNILDAAMVLGQNEVESKHYSVIRNTYNAFMNDYQSIIF